MKKNITDLLKQAEDGFMINCQNSDGSINLFARNTAGDSLLHVAVGRENISEIKFLLEKGLDINLQGDFLCTPLHLATSAKNKNIYKLLVSNGGDENIQNCLGDTPTSQRY
jgi:hypothetical protein